MNTTVCFHPLRSLRTALKAALLATLLAAVPAFAADDKTFDQESVLKDATEFFGSSTEGLAKVIEKAFKDQNVAVLVGDWTRGDAAIGRFLASHGRSGVTLYLVYRPGQPVEILPQLLTTGMLISAIAR